MPATPTPSASSPRPWNVRLRGLFPMGHLLMTILFRMSCVECIMFTPFLIAFFSVSLLFDVLFMIFTCRFLALFCECFGCCQPCWGQPFFNPGSEKSSESSPPVYYSHQLLQPPGIVANQFQHAMANAPPLESV